MPTPDHQPDYASLMQQLSTNPDAVEESDFDGDPAALFARAESFQQIAAIEQAFA